VLQGMSSTRWRGSIRPHLKQAVHRLQVEVLGQHRAFARSKESFGDSIKNLNSLLSGMITTLNERGRSSFKRAERT
jgi:hypothetical protein